MNVNLGFFKFHSWTNDWNGFMGKGCWFRIFGWGLHFTNGYMLFSERNGFEKRLKLPFGYRMKILKRGE